MKLKTPGLYVMTLLFVFSCTNSKSKSETPTQAIAENTTTPSGKNQQSDLVGEWEQQYTCYDKNGNYKLDPEEKIPSNAKFGFDWFRFNADGSCLRDKEVKFKSTYEIQNKGNTKHLVIRNVHSYTIVELTDKELILGAEGAFMAFMKIN